MWPGSRWPGSGGAWPAAFLLAELLGKQDPTKARRAQVLGRERGRGGWTRSSRAHHLFLPRGLPASRALNSGPSQPSAGCPPAGAPAKGAPRGLEGAVSTAHVVGDAEFLLPLPRTRQRPDNTALVCLWDGGCHAPAGLAGPAQVPCTGPGVRRSCNSGEL